MGMRLGRNLKSSAYEVAPRTEFRRTAAHRIRAGLEGRGCRHGRQGRRDRGARGSRTAIGKVAHAIVGKLNPGAMVVVLDAAAPYAGHLPKRTTSPISSPIPAIRRSSTNETDMAAKLDRFGGVAAKQAIVCALMQGPESDYAKARRWPHDLGPGHALASPHRRADRPA